jgi:hypothetical protein
MKIASSNATPASVGAESAVASAVGGQLASQVQKLAGISQLTPSTPPAGNSSNPVAQIAIQQRVTGNVLLTFSANATSAQNQSVQVQYQPNKNVCNRANYERVGSSIDDVACVRISAATRSWSAVLVQTS